MVLSLDISTSITGYAIIDDDGKGFDAELFYSGKGNGWKNIQTRLNLIKGEFDLDTTQGRRGTMMTVNLLETDMKEA